MSRATVVFVMVSSIVGSYVGQVFQVRPESGSLPNDTEPLSYKLNLKPNRYEERDAWFDGSVEIAIAVRTSTSEITLNAKNLRLNEISVTDKHTAREIRVISWSYVTSWEQVTIFLHEHVLANRTYMIHIRYRGILKDDGTWFFRSAYDTVSDGKKWIFATQFQTTGARSAFPCYDEPHFRTPFNISLLVNKKDTALSNMPSFRIGYENQFHERKRIYFRETPSMSTCSVTFVVGELERFDKTHPQVINVYSHLGRLYQIEYITKESPEILRAMKDYIGLPYYVMPKLNLIAAPTLGSGQVENWGLTIYLEKTLFVESQSNSKSIMTAKMAVAHAMASQWFGNLLSPAGWEFAWINRGLTTYLQYFVTAKVEPEWRLEHFFIVDIQRPTMELDQNQRQPLTAPAIGPGDVDYNSADRFSKQKAAAVMMMLNDWVGEEAFKKSINAYLTHNQYSSVKPEQLWNAFDNTLFDLTKFGLNGNSVRTVMNTWTERAGYPVVNVKKKDKSLVLTQQRFLPGFTNPNDTTKWFIRLSYTTNKEKNFDTKTAPTVWLDPSVNETFIPIDDDVEWYIFNIQSTGYYRVNYTEDNWLSLIKQLRNSPKDVHVLNRAQLIDDSFSLAKVGLLNYTIPMSMAEYLKKEDDIIPWFSAMKSFDYVINRMRRFRNEYLDVKAFFFNLAEATLLILNDIVAQKSPQRPIVIGWNALLTWVCKLENQYYSHQKESTYFKRWEFGEEISADIKDAAFCVGARQNFTPVTLDKLLNLYNTTKSYSERGSVMNGLPCADIQTLLTYLTLILENKCPIEPSDYEDFFNALSSTSNGITAMNDFLGKHFTDVVNNVNDGKNIAKTMFSILASKVSTDSEIENMMKMAFKSNTPVEYRNKLVPIYQNEIKDYEKWYHNGSPETIWKHINGLKKGLPLYPSAMYT